MQRTIGAWRASQQTGELPQYGVCGDMLNDGIESSQRWRGHESASSRPTAAIEEVHNKTQLAATTVKASGSQDTSVQSKELLQKIMSGTNNHPRSMSTPRLSRMQQRSTRAVVKDQRNELLQDTMSGTKGLPLSMSTSRLSRTQQHGCNKRQWTPWYRERYLRRPCLVSRIISREFA